MFKLKKHLDSEDFKMMYNLEKMFYDEAYITPVKEAYAWYKKNPDCTKAFYNDNELIGFCNLFPVYPEVFEQIGQGKFNDHEMTVEHMLDDENYYDGMNLFFSCIVIKEEYRCKALIEELIREAIKVYTPQLLGTVGIDRVVMDTVTPEGDKFAKACGLTKYGMSDHQSTIWIGTFDQLMKRYIKY